MKVRSLTSARYILTFINDWSRKCWIYCIANKSETLEKFIEFKKQVETQCGQKIGLIRSDRGGEYTSNQFVKHCENEGTRRHLTAGYSPHQNGIAERKNRSLLETTRSLGVEGNIPGYLWDEAAKAACYILNRCPTKALRLLTPEECFTKHKPNLSHLRIYGCAAYVHIPREKRSKLESKALCYVIVGYDDLSKAYRCYDPEKQRIIISKDVYFDETQLGIPNRDSS